jgi:hypothetical protein
MTQRVLVFRSPAGPSEPGFSISLTENSQGLTVQQWLDFTGCVPKSIKQGIVDGEAAIFCTSEAGEIPTSAALFEHAGTMFYVTSALMTPAEFELLIGSLRLEA